MRGISARRVAALSQFTQASEPTYSSFMHHEHKHAHKRRHVTVSPVACSNCSTCKKEKGGRRRRAAYQTLSGFFQMIQKYLADMEMISHLLYPFRTRWLYLESLRNFGFIIE